MFAATGSTITAASPSLYFRNASAAASRSLYGTTIVSAAAPVGTPGDAGIAERREARAGAREQRVGVAVVAAGRLEDPVAMRERARETQRAHRRLRPRGDEAHLLDRRHGVDDLRRELDLRLGRGAVARAAQRRLPHGLDRLRVGVTEDERPPGHDPVEEAAALGVDVRARPAPHEQRLVEADAAHRAHGRVDAAGDQLERAPVEVGACGVRAKREGRASSS